MDKWDVSSALAIFLLVCVASAQTSTSIDFPGSPATNVDRINSNGTVKVGDHFDVASGNEYANSLSGGSFSPFAFPSSMLTEGYGNNVAGTMVGDYTLTNVSGNYNDITSTDTC